MSKINECQVNIVKQYKEWNLFICFHIDVLTPAIYSQL